VLEVIWLLPAVALFGFAVLLVLGRRIGEPLAGWFATAICGTAFLLAAIAFGQMLSRPAEERSVLSVLYTWLPVGGLHVDMAFRADQLSIAMALFITGIGALIHLYAIGYMHGDPKFTKFFVYLNLFIFSMLVLVLGSNLVVTFLGWEGVGVCSYLLISFWQTRPSAATATFWRIWSVACWRMAPTPRLCRSPSILRCRSKTPSVRCRGSSSRARCATSGCARLGRRRCAARTKCIRWRRCRPMCWPGTDSTSRRTIADAMPWRR